MVLYLTRHGETDNNVLGKYCGSTDVSLNEAGFLQAHELKKRIRHIKIDKVYYEYSGKYPKTQFAKCIFFGGNGFRR